MVNFGKELGRAIIPEWGGSVERRSREVRFPSALVFGYREAASISALSGEPPRCLFSFLTGVWILVDVRS